MRSDPLLRLHCRLDASPAAVPLCAPGSGLRPPLIPPGAAGIAAVVAPVALVTRLLLDRYGIVLPAERVGVEPPGRHGPARVVPPASGALRAADDPGAARAALHETATAVRALGETAAAGSGLSAAETAAAIESARRSAWRYCGPATAALLSGEPDAAVHAVPVRQREVLTEVVDRVTAAARRRRTDPSLPPPAVMLDVDLCALVPRERSLVALREVAARFGIAEFGRPEELPLLPTYHPPSWRAYCEDVALWAPYPELDREAVFDAFWEGFFNPWDRMRADEPAAGLARFVWDVQDAGGQVVFNTGRRERVRDHTEAALARAGIVASRLVMVPDDRTRPVAEHKAENLRSFADLDVVAVFDDLADNRRAMAKELPEALIVAVAPPGFAAEPATDGAEVVAGFERTPGTGLGTDGRRAADLSHTRSLAELDLAELADHGDAAARHAVHLDAAASRALVSALLARSDADADRVAANAKRARSGADTAARVHHVLTRERFRKGPAANFSAATFTALCGRFLTAGEPIPAVTFGFPVKLHYNDLKTAGPRPDLAELAALVRLRELDRAVRAVYPPGLRITVLTDGDHFERRPAEQLRRYHEDLASFHDLVGGSAVCDLVDVETLAAARLGESVVAGREERIDVEIAAMNRLLAGLDVRTAPVAALAEATRRCAAEARDRGDGTPMPGFGDLYRSLMYVVPLSVPDGTARGAWARRVYADAFHVADPGAGPDLRDARAGMLAEAWRRTVRYLAVLTVDRDLGYDDSTLFPGRIRLTPNPRPGALGFTYLGGSGVLPWHGTGALDPRCRVSTDFAVALADRGYVPVYSELLDAAQPWFMAPSTLVEDGRLHPTVARDIRLRRR